MAGHRTTFRFGISPALGHERTQVLAERIAEALAPLAPGPIEVVVGGSYEHLQAMLLGGALDVAWVNPLVLARMHAAGASASLRGVRHGSTTFRSALVVRKGFGGFERLAGGRAAWTDPDSLAGYRLPIGYLRRAGLQPERIFVAERFTFSYPTSLRRVLEGQADVAACFVHAADDEALAGVLERLVGSDAEGLAPLAYTAPVPNDGLVFAPHLPAKETERLCERTEALLCAPAGRALLELLGMEAVIRADDDPVGEMALRNGQRLGP